MSVLKIARRLVAIVALVAVSPAVMGETFHPFAEKIDYNPDWQFFAPVDLDELSQMPSRKRANVGWYAAYDRTYMWTSRPETEQSKAFGDSAHGNRWDVGFMTSNRSGWLASFRHIGGPNEYHNVYQQRINIVNENNPPIIPQIDENDRTYGSRVYILGDSVNVAGVSNYEINKVWRREPYRYGGTIEPMVGLKYMVFNDTALNQSYFRSFNLISDPGAISTDAVVENLISNETYIKNQMFGGQLGFRYFTYYDRWTVSGEFRAFGLQNFQKRQFRQLTYSTEYDGVDRDASVVATDFASGSNFFDSSNSEFVVGFEARAEAAYQFTRDFCVRGGVDVMDLATGIWRGANPGFGNVNEHSQDVQLAGFSLGLTFNR